MNYYILNINYDKESKVDYWLDERKLAPIFYGSYTIDQIRNNHGHELTRNQYRDAICFVETFYGGHSDAIIFSIGNENVYIYKQVGSLQEVEMLDHNLVKAFKIEIIQKIKIKECPLILVSIKAARFIGSGTFKNLSHPRYFGNSKALDYLLDDQKPVNVSNFKEYLKCLSSLEFETLIAKYLEESGLFVPAYKGGYIKNFDLFCKNITKENVIVDRIHVAPKDSVSVQIKLHLSKNDYKIHADHFFCISSDVSADNIHDYEYLHRNINISPITKKWLENTLYWVNNNS